MCLKCYRDTMLQIIAMLTIGQNATPHLEPASVEGVSAEDQAKHIESLAALGHRMIDLLTITLPNKHDPDGAMGIGMVRLDLDDTIRDGLTRLFAGLDAQAIHELGAACGHAAQCFNIAWQACSEGLKALAHAGDEDAAGRLTTVKLGPPPEILELFRALGATVPVQPPPFSPPPSGMSS